MVEAVAAADVSRPALRHCAVALCARRDVSAVQTAASAPRTAVRVEVKGRVRVRWQRKRLPARGGYSMVGDCRTKSQETAEIMVPRAASAHHDTSAAWIAFSLVLLICCLR